MFTVLLKCRVRICCANNLNKIHTNLFFLYFFSFFEILCYETVGSVFILLSVLDAFHEVTFVLFIYCEWSFEISNSRL